MTQYKTDKRLDKALCIRAGGEWIEGKCVSALCETCGSTGDFRGLSRSHIISKGRQGKNTLENILIECYPCHELYEKHPERRKKSERRVFNN